LRAVLLVALLASAPALADKKAAQALMHEGVSAYAAQDWKGALAAFLASYQAAPSYEVLQNIGLCQKQLGQFNDAVASFEAYLKQGGKRIPLDRRAKAVELLQEIRAFTGAVDVLADGASAEVSVDGVRAGKTPLSKLLLAPGPRRFTLTREGFATWERTYQIVSGSDVAVSATLEPLPVASAPLAPAPASAAPVPLADSAPVPLASSQATAEQEPPSPVLGIMGLVSGVVLVGIAIPFAVDSNNAYAETAALYESEATWDSAKNARQQWGKTGRILSIVGFAAGGALLIAGAVGTLVTFTSSSPQAPVVQLMVAPGPNGGWVLLQGSF
jgi:tetratricopeptide (TPR) repeat protein